MEFRRVLFRSLPKAAVNPSGVGSTQENGASYYAHQLKQSTTTSMTAEEIHQLGLSEVARLRGEMEKVNAKVGVQGDLPAFLKKTGRATNREEVGQTEEVAVGV